MGDETGQATIEWVGLLLVAVLTVGALAAFRAPAEERGLGKALARRLACVPGGACGAGGSPAPSGVGIPRLEAVVGGAGVRARGAARARPGSEPAGPMPESRPRRRRVSRSRAVDAFRRLRGVGELSKRVWIVCLGYRRFLNELDNPRAPTEAMPLDEAIEIANDCLNPAAFLAVDQWP